jgi:hypothetical protein
MQGDLVARVRRAMLDPDEPDVDLPHLRHAQYMAGPSHRKSDQDDDDEYSKHGVELPWPARNREGKMNKIAKAFYHGYAFPKC